MVPIHCRGLAEDLVGRVNLRPGEQVLDVASGTGVVSRYAANRVGTLGKVTGVELNPAMIEVARNASLYFDQIKYLEGDAMALPVPDDEFDAVLCQQAVMFFPDRELAVREMHRTLKPGGRVGVNVFRTPEFVPAFAHLIQALDKHAGAEAADFMRAPFIMEDAAQMRTLFEQAGFENIEVVIRIDALRYPSVEHLVRYETLNMSDTGIHTAEVQAALTREMETLCARNIDDHGVVFPVQQFVVVATK
jgi:ubiquinone/menaquinone biosynthesis C-methylase UbiE